MNEHGTTLAHAAEIIRQELVGMGTIASNYAEEARKALTTFIVVYDCLLQLLGPSKPTPTTQERGKL